MLSYGFYNSVNGDRIYNAVQISSMFDGVISDGIFTSIGNGFAVAPSGDVSYPYRLHIKSGKAWFNHTWNTNDSVETIDIPAAPVGTAWRWDMVALQINRSSAVRTNSFVVVSGTAGENPTKPVPAGWVNGARNSQELQQYPIAYVKVYGTGDTQRYIGKIDNSMIENNEDAKGSVMCPYATTVTSTWDSTQLYIRWLGEFTNWLAARTTEFNTFMTTSGNTFSTFMSNSTSTFNTFMSNSTATFNTFMTTSGTTFNTFMSTSGDTFDDFIEDKDDDFDTWFATVQGQISGDLGSKLSLAVLTTSTKTIAPSDWTAVGNPVNYYKHTVAVENLTGGALTSDARVEIYLNLGGSDYSTASDKIKQYGYIYAAEFDATRTHITLYSRALPTHNLPIGFVGALLDT